MQSWIENREVQSEKANLTILFERYVPVLIEAHRTGRFKMITPIQEVCTTVEPLYCRTPLGQPKVS